MALDILHDNWGPYTHTEVENALKAYLSGLEDRINQAIQSGGVGLTDLSQEVQALLNKADTALQSETDPTVPNWAKQSNKPTYNVSEIIYSSNRPLSSKLDEMTAEILAAGATDSEMSDSSKKPVQNKVIKAYVDGLIQGLQNVLNTITQDGATQGVIDTFNEVKAFLEGISSSDTLAAKLATLVPQTRTINGKALSSNVTIGMSDIQGLVDAINNAGSGAVSVTTNQDGTFVIHVGETDYTINLNHTHENMAKLIVCEEGDLPSTLDPATIYAITDSGETEIEKLIIRGMEFAGGGGSSSPTYDAEIEYLQATGTQFINTAISVGVSQFECEIKAELTENQGIFDTILGACENVSNKIYSIPLAINGSGEFYVQFKDNFAAKSANATGLHVFKSKLINNVVTIDVDGSTASTNIATSSGSITSLDLFLFARNMAGVADRLVKAKIYYCKIWNNGLLVCDFIPVRVGQVGYMYDRVRSRFFGNRGSGSFTLGNDKQ